MILNYKTVYFSPTNTTQKIIREVSNIISLNVEELDITNYREVFGKLTFEPDDFVILGIPVYSGRVPQVARERISNMIGKDTPIALIATYGNRDYDDALLELKILVQSNGFICIAAAAFVTEHSVVNKFGAGRPNAKDLESIRKFSQQLKDKVYSWSKKTHTDVFVEGNSIYRKYKTIPIKPHATSKCIKCGICSKNCPVMAIPSSNPKKTDRNKCITCVRCIKICPKSARCFHLIEKIVAEKSLEKLCREYKEPEIFI